MVIINEMERIRDCQTVHYPKHDDIRLAIPDYTAGWASAIYDHKFNKWVIIHHETREEAIKRYTDLKEMCQQFPEVFNWFCYSEMYVYSSMGHSKPKWALHFMITED